MFDSVINNSILLRSHKRIDLGKRDREKERSRERENERKREREKERKREHETGRKKSNTSLVLISLTEPTSL